METLIEQHYQQLSPKLKQISVKILERKEQFVMLTISNCSKELGVSEATLTRFSRALGFPSYREFQNYLRALLLSQLDQRDKLFHNIDQDSQSRNILHYSISKDIKTMTTGLETVDLEKFEQAAAIIASAAKLYIMGLGISKSLASFLEFRLRRVGMQIRTLVNGGQEFIENLLSLRAGDAILAIGFQRSYKEISVALEYARKLGVSTVALVENPLSPLARKSDISLNIKRGPTEELNSLAFPMSVCNALALRVAYEKKEQAIAASKDLDWLNQKLAAATQNPEFPE